MITWCVWRNDRQKLNVISRLHNMSQSPDQSSVRNFLQSLNSNHHNFPSHHWIPLLFHTQPSKTQTLHPQHTPNSKPISQFQSLFKTDKTQKQKNVHYHCENQKPPNEWAFLRWKKQRQSRRRRALSSMFALTSHWLISVKGHVKVPKPSLTHSVWLYEHTIEEPLGLMKNRTNQAQSFGLSWKLSPTLLHVGCVWML